MIGTERLDELRRMYQHAVATPHLTAEPPSVGCMTAGDPALHDALPGLLDEIDRLRTENARLKDGLGEVRELLATPLPKMGGRVALSPVGLL
jgi:hypothetical protein